MSDSIIQAMKRMDQIRSRIEEIRKLGTGERPERADAASGSGGTTGTSGSGTEQFALLLQEAQASLFQDETETSAAGGSAITGGGLTGGALPETLLNRLGGGSQGDIDPALIARALEIYKERK
jgi:hypothetical protein